MLQRVGSLQILIIIPSTVEVHVAEPVVIWSVPATRTGTIPDSATMCLVSNRSVYYPYGRTTHGGLYL